MRLLAAAVLSALVVAPSAGAERFDRLGISFSYPASWHVTTRPLSNVVQPVTRFTVATFVPRRVPSDRGPCLAGIARQRGARGAYAYLQEATGADRKLRRFPPRRPGLFRLPVRGELAMCDGRWSRWIPFRQAGRAFYLGISVGPKATRETRRQLRWILAGLDIDRLG